LLELTTQEQGQTNTCLHHVEVEGAISVGCDQVTPLTKTIFCMLCVFLTDELYVDTDAHTTFE
jgi:hypothetical protein